MAAARSSRGWNQSGGGVRRRCLLACACSGLFLLSLSGNASAAQELGPVDLGAYCRSTGWDAAVLEGPPQGPNAAYTWACERGGGSEHGSVDVQAACRRQYGVPDATASPTNVNDAYTWRCYRPQAGSPADGYEPNDASEQATGPLRGGVTYAANVDPYDRAGSFGNDQDWFFFNAAGGRALEISIKSEGGCLLKSQLIEAAGFRGVDNPYVDSGTTVTIRYTPPTAGRYYLRFTDVACPSFSPYSFIITPADAVTGSPTPVPPPPAGGGGTTTPSGQSTFRLRAIGDSVTAGFGYDSFGKGVPARYMLKCIRKPSRSDCQSPAEVSYVRHVADAFAIKSWANLAQSGATPTDWLSGPYQGSLTAVRDYNPTATLLTLGANPPLSDFMLSASGQWCARKLGDNVKCIERKLDQAGVSTYLAAVYRVLLAAPGNHVFVVSYPAATPRLLSGKKKVAAQLLTSLNARVVQAVSMVRKARPDLGRRLYLVSPGDFTKHGCTARDPWIQVRDSCIHPNSKGQRIIAASVVKAIRASGIR